MILQSGFLTFKKKHWGNPSGYTGQRCYAYLVSMCQVLADTSSGKESACQCRRCKGLGFDPWVGKIPWRRKWQPTPVFLPENSHGQRSLAGYGPWGQKESDMIEYSCSRTHRGNSNVFPDLKTHLSSDNYVPASSILGKINHLGINL